MGPSAPWVSTEVVWARMLTYHLLVYDLVLIGTTLLMPQGVVMWLRRMRLVPRDLPL